MGSTVILVDWRFIHNQVKITTNSTTNTAMHIKTNDEELRLVAVYKSPKHLSNGRLLP